MKDKELNQRRSRIKICIFPNDPLLAYHTKGEIKQGYFNPKDFFDEVHIISLFDEEIEADKVKQLAGNATLDIHKIEKVDLSNFKLFEERISSLVKLINPAIIRSYNPRVQGWLAVKAGQKLAIPTVISLHTNYDQQRLEAFKEQGIKQYLKLLYAKKLERYCLENADAIICVYEYILPYAKKLGAYNPQVIYNKIDLNNFKPQQKSDSRQIISIGRLTNQKPHHLIIQAMAYLNANLLIIGDGPNFNSLQKLIKHLELPTKVQIIKSVANEDIPKYLVASTVYVQPMNNLDGIPIPVLEAMASGLPVVMSKHSNKYSEITDRAIHFVDNNPKSFASSIRPLLLYKNYRKIWSEKSLEVINQISGEKMEDKELSLYKEVINKRIPGLIDYCFYCKQKIVETVENHIKAIHPEALL